MRTLIALLLCLAPLTAFAQDADKAKAEAERRAEWRLRSYRSLNLTEAQKAEIKKLIVAEELASVKARDARRAGVTKLLDDKQKKTFSDMVNRGNRGRGGNNRQRSSSASSRLSWLGLDADRFAKPMKMDAEQKKKLEATLAPAVKRLEEARSKQRQGRWDYAKWRAFALQLRQEFRPKIAQMLDEDQKEIFDKLNQEWDDQVNKVYKRWQERQNEDNSARTTGGSGRKGKADPASLAKQLLAEVMAALGLGPEETAVLQPMIKALIDHKIIGGHELANQRDTLAKTTAAAPGDDKIKTAVAGYREAQKAWSDKLTELQDQVRELLVLSQEAVLVSRDLLP